VGCGIISEAHLRAYRQHAGRARITACCDIDPGRAARRAAEAGGARAVSRLEDALADPDVDAVEICTPHPFHAEAAVAAARAGKHVLCQKPLAKTLSECDAMIAAAREAGVVLFYGETNHTMPAAVEAKRAVEQGRIGQLIGVQATYAHWQGGRYLSTAWRYDPNVTVLTLGGPHGALALHRPDLPDRREVLLETGGDTFAHMIGRYLDAVLEGAPNPSPGEVGRENLRVVLTAYESARLGREVRLVEIEPCMP
jgi:predicted dehydrogenase